LRHQQRRRTRGMTGSIAVTRPLAGRHNLNRGLPSDVADRHRRFDHHQRPLAESQHLLRTASAAPRSTGLPIQGAARPSSSAAGRAGPAGGSWPANRGNSRAMGRRGSRRQLGRIDRVAPRGPPRVPHRLGPAEPSWASGLGQAHGGPDGSQADEGRGRTASHHEPGMEGFRRQQNSPPGFSGKISSTYRHSSPCSSPPLFVLVVTLGRRGRSPARRKGLAFAAGMGSA